MKCKFICYELRLLCDKPIFLVLIKIHLKSNIVNHELFARKLNNKAKENKTECKVLSLKLL